MDIWLGDFQSGYLQKVTVKESLTGLVKFFLCA